MDESNFFLHLKCRIKALCAKAVDSLAMSEATAFAQSAFTATVSMLFSLLFQLNR